jgi:hypothetical protein
MANLRGAMTALIAFAGCTAMQSPPVPTSADHPLGYVDSVRFEISSWGHPLEQFEIGITGLGEYRRATADGVALEIHRFSAGPAGFARMRAVLAGIEHFASKAPVCGNRMTDFPYGEIAWVDGLRPTAVRFDVGCQGPEMQRVVAAAHQAARLAEEFSRTNPVR